MPEYISPEAFAMETPGRMGAVRPVPSAIAGFVGQAPARDARLGEAVRVRSWLAFRDIYAPEGAPATPLAQAAYGFFLNGGADLYVVNTGEAEAITDKGTGLALLDAAPVCLIAAPGKTDAASHDALLSSAEQHGDRFAILDSPLSVPDIARLGAPESEHGDGLRARHSRGGFGAQYAGGLMADDCMAPGEAVQTYPSGYVAGLYALTDQTRGVHHAPANMAMRGVRDLTQAVTMDELGDLYAAGVNCFRNIPGKGVTPWGVRTLATEGSEYSYIQVRRLSSMIAQSIRQGLQWAAFEPNDPRLWGRVTADVMAFMQSLWRQGAFVGATPHEAFIVKCDEVTNPPETREEGILTVQVLFAPIFPAEFIVLMIDQIVQAR